MSDIKKFNAMFLQMYLEIGKEMRNKPEFYNTRVAEDASDVTASNTPLILIDVTDSMQTQFGSTLDYRENRISFTITVDITAQNGIANRRDICERLREHIYEYFVNRRGMFPAGNHKFQLLEEKKQRVVSRFTGVYDIEQDKIYKQ